MGLFMDTPNPWCWFVCVPIHFNCSQVLVQGFSLLDTTKVTAPVVPPVGLVALRGLQATLLAVQACRPGSIAWASGLNKTHKTRCRMRGGLNYVELDTVELDRLERV